MKKTEKKPIIELKDVWKTYHVGETIVQALRGLSLEVFKYDFLAVQGPSGSGKSTAMNLIGCLDIPTKGAIYLDSQNIASLEESELAQIRGRKIGFIFQQFNLINTLTALENVMLPLIFQEMPQQKRIARAESVLKKVGLTERMHHKPTQLSGGQQQRVAIARALAVDPEVILADEPTGNLDSKMGKEIMDLLKDLNKKEKKTVVLVTHDDKLAKMTDRIAFLKDGKILKESKKVRK